MTPEKQDGTGEIFFNFRPFRSGHSHLLTSIIYVITSVTQMSFGVLKGSLLPKPGQMLSWV